MKKIISTTNDNIQVNKSDEYILIFDNMQCNMKNIMNIQMLLLEPKIYIFIPFILCCENINVNIKDNDDNEDNNGEQNDNNIKNIQDSYNKLKNKIIVSDKINIVESNFCNEDGELKEEYIYESLLIGFDYKKNKLLNFRNINSLNKMTEKTKELLYDFIDFIQLINNFDTTNYKDFIEYKKIINSINLIDINMVLKYKKTKKITKSIKEKKEHIFNKIKSIIYSMKEMRDWFYVKEIVKKNNDHTLINNNVIYCTSDSINLFRSILYNISTINLHNNNIKYISLYENINNKKYIIYKQISPSYYYKFGNNEQNNIKQNIFNEINKLNTIIIKKEVILIGGSQTQTLVNTNDLKTKKYILKCSNMDYVDLRFKLYNVLNSFSSSINYINGELFFYKDLKKNNFDEIIELFKDINNDIIKLHNFSKTYKLNDLKCIDYNCEKLSDKETNYISSSVDEDFNFDFNLNYYKNELKKIKSILIDDLDKIKSKILCEKFYYDSEYKLTNEEFNFTVLLYYMVESACEVSEREKLGYKLKMLLSDNDWKLFRNAFHLFYDNEFDYPNYIKGKYKFVETFDENKYDYRTKIVHNEFYPDDFDSKPVEDFERKDIFSKYDLIQQFIKDNNLDN